MRFIDKRQKAISKSFSKPLTRTSLACNDSDPGNRGALLFGLVGEKGSVLGVIDSLRKEKNNSDDETQFFKNFSQHAFIRNRYFIEYRAQLDGSNKFFRYSSILTKMDLKRTITPKTIF